MKCPDKDIWFRSLANEFVRLAQVVGTRIKETSTLPFFPKRKAPFATKTVTYGRIVCDIRPNKANTHRSILKVSGNFLYFEGGLSTPTATITTANLMVNNIISTKNGKRLCLDIRNTYI